LAPSDLTFGDLERSKMKVTIFDAKYLGNGERYDVGLNGGPIGNRPWAVVWHPQI
jgi:hypothetical protein